jgi:hypothetical protein
MLQLEPRVAICKSDNCVPVRTNEKTEQRLPSLDMDRILKLLDKGTPSNALKPTPILNPLNSEMFDPNRLADRSDKEECIIKKSNVETGAAARE